MRCIWTMIFRLLHLGGERRLDARRAQNGFQRFLEEYRSLQKIRFERHKS